MSKIKVLIVDDSPFIHKAITRALDSDDYEICGIAKNGREGVELYSAHRPDVVTMDITMPVMDGLAAAREIMSGDPGARIVMMSAMGDEEIMAEARNCGISQFIQKPFKNPDLAAALKKACQ